jgi:hypothetical protein
MVGPYAAELGENGVRLPAIEAQQLQRLYVEVQTVFCITSPVVANFC